MRDVVYFSEKINFKSTCAHMFGEVLAEDNDTRRMQYNLVSLYDGGAECCTIEINSTNPNGSFSYECVLKKNNQRIHI